MLHTMSSLSLARQTGAAVRLLLVLTLLVGLVYPAGVWALGQVAFRDQAGGSLVQRQGQVVGSSLIGQQWTGPQWFHGRPSASDYAGDTSGGSNLAESDPRLQAEVGKRRAVAGGGDVPPDALTAGASGLDPHISPEYATRQISRVATARDLSPDRVRALVGAHTRQPTLNYLGEPRVDVLALNLALAAADQRP